MTDHPTCGPDADALQLAGGTVGESGFLGAARAAGRAMYAAVDTEGGTVRDALDHLAMWPQSMNRDEFLADVEVLLTTVRAATLADVERVVTEELNDFYSVEYGDVTDKKVVYVEELMAAIRAMRDQ